MLFQILFSLALAQISAFGAPAESSIALLPEASQVTFRAVGRPSMLKIHGEKAKPTGKIVFSKNGKISGEIRVDLEQFETGIALRDRHMKEKYLETGKEGNRFAILQIEKFSVPPDFFSSQKPGEFAYSGTLKLHGVSKPIQGTLKVEEKKADSLKGSTGFAIKLSDYGIQIPSFSGVTVAENVEIEVKFDAKASTIK